VTDIHKFCLCEIEFYQNASKRNAMGHYEAKASGSEQNWCGGAKASLK